MDELDAPQENYDSGGEYEAPSVSDGSDNYEGEPQDPNFADETPSTSEREVTPEARRIAVLTKARRQAERERDEKHAMFETLAAQNRNLSALVETFKNTVDKAQTVDPGKALDSQIATVRAEIAQAHDSGDTRRAFELMEIMTDLKAEKAVSKMKSEIPATRNDQNFNPQAFEQKMLAQNVIQGEKAFLTSHPEAKTMLSGYVNSLANDPRWKGEPPHKIFGHALKMTKSFFQKNRLSVPSVEGASSGYRTPSTSGLTPKEKEVARAVFRGTGLSDADAEKKYLAQKNFLNGAS